MRMTLKYIMQKIYNSVQCKKFKLEVDETS